MRRLTPLLLACAMGLAACETGPSRATANAEADSIRTLSTKLAEATAVSAQQDSLLQGFKESAQLLDDIDKEISKVKGLKAVKRVKAGEGPNDPRIAAREDLLAKVQQVTKLLAANRARVRALSTRSDSLSARLGDYEQTISSLEGIVERQKTDIATLTASVDSLKTQNTMITAQRDAVTDTAHTLRHEVNTVYYAIGTRDELKKKGIVVEEGAKHYLLFGGRTVVPARVLDPSAFTTIDKYADVEIPLPDPTRPYRIISRQNPALVEPMKDADGKPTGRLRVTDPTQFWSASKYLIIVTG